MDELTKAQGISAEELEAMSPVELAEALEQALDSMTEETYDPAVIDAYLDALDRKAPMTPPPDTETAFRDFQRRLQGLSLPDAVPSGIRDSPAPPPKKRFLRRAVVSVAAAAALLFTLMIGAQAAGMDVFGNLARWTDERLYPLLSGEGARNKEYQDLFQQALKDYDLPTGLAPGWYPKGGTPELQTWNNESGLSGSVQLSFTNESGEYYFTIRIDQYANAEETKLLVEKDTEPVDIYAKGDRTFYIYSNVNITSATSTSDNLMVVIKGHLTIDEVKKMINSMGG